MPQAESRYVYEDQRTLPRRGPTFDRVAYAMRVLRALQPEGLHVAVCEGRWSLRVQRGRDWSPGADGEWVLLTIPPDATYEHIAVAIAELSGRRGDPFVIDTLLALRHAV